MITSKLNAVYNFLFSRDNNLNTYVARHNAQMGVYVGWGIAAVEVLFIINTLLQWESGLYPSKLIAYVIMGVMSVALAILARRRLKQAGYVHAFMGYLILYLVAASVYGINNSLIDFAAGKQIITFYMTMMMNTCVFVTPPIGMLTNVAISYAAMYLMGFSGGRMDPGSLLLFVVSGVIVGAASLLRYNDARLGAASERALADLSAHDGLTGLRNRMALREDFDSMIGRDQYVVMADLDDFKHVNDTYGHEAGDAVLVAYAKALRAHFPNATCYRYGGDEFLLFVPTNNDYDVEDSAQELVEGFSTVDLDTGGCVEVGSSIGYARGVAHDATELRRFMRAADNNLYAEKNLKKAG